MSNDDYATTFERAKAYPFVDASMFKDSSLISVQTGKITHIHDAIAIQRSVFDQQLEGSTDFLPSYDLILSTGEVLHDRIPVIAIGSNSSPDVMIKKFNDKGMSGDFAILQATINDHSVAHGAFVGAKGTIPATLIPDQGSSTHITVGFYTKEQADALTTTEPNYDLVALDSEVQLRGFNPSVPPGSLGYVSPWGALSKDGEHPLILASIPSTSPREAASSTEAMDLIAKIVNPETNSTEDWFNTLSLGIESRLKVNNTLQAHALPAVIAGTQIKPSTIGDAAEKHGYARPAINYV